MKFSTLSTNKELNIFTETNNSWKIENTLYGCNDIPTSSQDGNILVDKKDNMLEIRSLLEPYYGKVVYRINRRFPIVDFSINAIGDKIKVFTQDLRRKDESCIDYSTFYTDGNPLLWNETDYEFSFRMKLHNNTPVNYTHKICSLFTDDNKLVILFNNSNYFYNRYTTAKNIQIISRYARAR